MKCTWHLFIESRCFISSISYLLLYHARYLPQWHHICGCVIRCARHCHQLNTLQPWYNYSMHPVQTAWWSSWQLVGSERGTKKTPKFGRDESTSLLGKPQWQTLYQGNSTTLGKKPLTITAQPNAWHIVLKVEWWHSECPRPENPYPSLALSASTWHLCINRKEEEGGGGVQQQCTLVQMPRLI